MLFGSVVEGEKSDLVGCNSDFFFNIMMRTSHVRSRKKNIIKRILEVPISLSMTIMHFVTISFDT